MYRDVENIEPLTKEDMLEFFRSYFLPSSPTRAKTSVWLVAQASAADLAANTSTAEKREKLVNVVSDLLGQLDVEADPAALTKQFEKIDVESGDTEGIINAVGAYLREVAGMAAEEVDEVFEQGREVLTGVLPSLGIVAQDAQTNGTHEETLPNGEASSKTVVIEDVKAFKASMPLSAGAKPVKDLSEFEELGAKL